MAKLKPPVSRYISGKSPTHSSTLKLGTHFKGLSNENLYAILTAYGLMSEEGRPRAKAVKLGYMDQCGSNLIWNLKSVEKLLRKSGLSPERIPANQELPDVADDYMASLTDIGRYFDVSGAVVGRWLTKLGYRTPEGAPYTAVLRKKHAERIKIAAGRSTKNFYKWNLLWTLKTLQGAGHLFDFDVEKSLAATRTDGGVEVVTREERARGFAKEFLKVYNDPKTRYRAERVVEGIPPRSIPLVERMVGKHKGWISSGEYMDGYRATRL